MTRMADGFALLAVVLLIVGCGDSDYSTPTATYRTYHRACQAGDVQALRRCHTEETLRLQAEIDRIYDEIAAGDPELAEKARRNRERQGEVLRSAARNTQVKLGNERIADSTASLDVWLDGKKTTFHFTKERDGWKIDLPKEELQADKKRAEAIGELLLLHPE